MKRKPELAAEPSTVPDLISRIAESPAVTRFRVATRGTIRIEDTATGESVEFEGPALFVMVHERLLSAGW